MPVIAEIDEEHLPPSTVVVSIDAWEGLSRLFVVDAQFFVDDPNLDLDELLLSEATVRVFDNLRPDDVASERVFHGVIEEATFVAPHGNMFVYRVRLRPRIYGLSQRVRSRTFQHQSTPQIVRRVFVDAGIPDDSVEWGLTAEYLPREFCVQYRESELDFTMRLLEEEGIFFWFEHVPGQHALRIADRQAAFQPVPDLPALPVATRSSAESGIDRLTDVSVTAQHVHDSYACRYWDAFSPEKAREATDAVDSARKFELYEYPVPFVQPPVGQMRAQRRLAAQRTRQVVLRASSGCRRLFPGRTFEMSAAWPDSLSGDYLVLSAHTRFVSGDLHGGASVFRCDIEAIPAEIEYRPPLQAPRPRVAGQESAVVTGPPGDEIHVDQWGRIKAHFYWDREGKMDDTSSCWIRTQQLNTESSQILPRLGWEMALAFADGDPSHPVALQKLYNAETMPPYALPDNLMQSALQSSSSPGGHGTNELRLNDSNGAMEWFLHAQRDLSLKVGNDMTETVTVDAVQETKSDSKFKVEKNETLTVSGGQSTSVTGRATHETVADKSVSIGGIDKWGVKSLYSIDTGGSRSETIGGLMNVLCSRSDENFKADHSLTVGGALAMNSAGPIVEAVAGNKTELVGGAKMELIRKAKQEDIKVAKLLTAGAVSVKTGTDIGIAADAAMAITVGGPVAIKCSGDFNIMGSSVTFTVGSAKLTAGAEIKASAGSVKVKANSLGSDGQNTTLSGTVKYE